MPYTFSYVYVACFKDVRILEGLDRVLWVDVHKRICLITHKKVNTLYN